MYGEQVMLESDPAELYGVETFEAQYPELTVRHTTLFHDRFLVLDEIEGYLVGSSLKEASKKSFAVARIEDLSIIETILSTLGT